MEQGWISLHRKILDNPIVCKDSDYFSVWCYLLLNATHDSYDAEFKSKRITLKKGQLITGRKVISDKFNISESKVQRILKKLEIEQQIEQQTSNKKRLITVLNWSDYQKSNNKTTTSEQQVNTNNNDNNENNKYIVDYLNEKASKNFKHTSAKTKEKISARFNEGFTVDDFKRVIDIKVGSWLKDKEMNKYLRPETLFGTKFESYLNEELKEIQTGPVGVQIIKTRRPEGEY